MKRDSYDHSGGPLFAKTRDAAAAELRAEVGATRAAEKAKRLDAGWEGSALQAVELYAKTHETFLSEDVRPYVPMPEGSDPRAWGAIMRAAQARGWIVADGAAPANSSNRSFKVRWRSRIVAGRA